MKHKFMKFSLFFSFLGLALVALSSFTATDEGDGQYHKAVGGGCTYVCYWIDNTGKTQTINRAGTFTSCPSTTTPSTCTPMDCTPVLACPSNIN